MEEVLGRVARGYWPPEAVFSKEMVPFLKDAGYEYVLLDGSTLMTGDEQSVDPYRTYQLAYKGDSITVAPCDSGFSQAQGQGLDAPWLADELRNGLSLSPVSDAPYLLTSCSDGENGEWFRREDEEEGFFGHFFSPYMEFCETGEFPVRPVNLTHYVHNHPARQAVNLRHDITRERSSWQYPAEQKAVFERLFKLSQKYWSLVKRSGKATGGGFHEMLAKFRELILQVQGSGYLLAQGKQHESMIELLQQADSLLGAAEEVSTAPPRRKAAGKTAPARKKSRTNKKRQP